jgi:hypothetical protein
MDHSVESLPVEQRIARYREMVAEALRVANDAQDQEVRMHLREVAAVWAALADKAEREQEERTHAAGSSSGSDDGTQAWMKD